MNATNKTATRRRAARGAGYVVGMALAAALPVLAAAAPAYAEEQAPSFSGQAVTSPATSGEDDGLMPLPDVGGTLTDVVDDLVDIHDWG